MRTRVLNKRQLSDFIKFLDEAMQDMCDKPEKYHDLTYEIYFNIRQKLPPLMTLTSEKFSEIAGDELRKSYLPRYEEIIREENPHWPEEQTQRNLESELSARLAAYERAFSSYCDELAPRWYQKWK